MRWAEPREQYDPEADVGLPRPFLLGEKIDKPFVTHSLQRPKSPEEISPFRPGPYVPPKFITLPHNLDRYRNLKDPGTRLVYLDKKLVAYFRNFRYLITGGLYIPVNRILGGRYGAGVFIESRVGGQTFFTRAGWEGQLGMTDLLPRTGANQKNIARYALYLWRHDRGLYRDFRDQFNKWKASVRDDSRRAYDDWYASRRNEWNQWAASVRRKMKPDTRWALPK